jgi:hypothetical protein
VNALQTADDRAALADPAERINEQHRLAISHRDRAIEHALEAGRLLLMVKQRLARGEFMPWIELNCDFAYSTAARYMTAAERNSTGVEISSLSALFPSGHKPARQPAPAKDDPKPATTTPAVRPRTTPQPTVVHDDGPPPGVTEEDGIPSEDEIAALERAERESKERIDQIIASDDRLAAAAAEIKRQGAEIAGLKVSRDGFMNGKLAITELLKAEQRKAERQSKLIDHLRQEIEKLTAALPSDTSPLQERIERLETENAALRERIAIMEESR